MAKKLKVEVEADAAPARRELQKLDGTVSRSTSNLRATARVFAGMGIKMAANFAAQHMQQGSAGQSAVGVGGGVLSGALQGSAAGPWGAVAGGIMGAVTALQELSAASKQVAEAEKARREAIEAKNAKNRKDFEEMEADEKRAAEFNEKLKELSSIKNVGQRRDAIFKAIADKKEEIRINGDALYGYSSNSHIDESEEFAAARAKRSVLNSELAQLQSLFDKMPTVPAFRVSETGVDAISRLGGNFGGGDYSREQLAEAKKTNELLGRLERKPSSAFDR